MSRPLPEKRPPFPPTIYRRKRKSLYIKCFLSFIVGGKVGGMVGGNAGEIPLRPLPWRFCGEKAFIPRPQFGAFRVGASAPCSLRFGPRVGTLGIEPPPELLRHPRGQKSSRRPLGRWRLPRAHFKNHFENRPSPSPAHKRPSTPGGPISTNARGEPHPSGAPYKKPNPNSRFFGVAQRPDTPLRFRFHALQESPAVKRPRPVSFDWPFHFSIFPPKIGTFFTPPLFQAPNPSRYVR